ncbi:MAG: aldehyde ferredoxin oxidoreductase, partial [Pelosinus sp.]|nr:aldehyde ferredoxin oxidoreductase [Pelosinus sp.]
MFYRVNMSTLTVSIDEGARYQGLGGRVLCQRIIQTEAALDAHPLSERNKLIFAAGLLSGTGAAGVGRLFLGAKSPLTNHVTESSAGGGMDNKLGRLGIQGIILEGMAKKSAYILHISSQGAILQEVPELRGLNIFAAVKSLKKSYAGKPSIGCIGTAGENKLLTACIGFTDWQGNSTRQAGRGGLGAVMGSKGLKAIVVDDSEAGKVFLADEKAFAAGAKKLASSLLA